MDKIDLSLKMRRLAQWVDSQRQPPSLIRKEFRGTPFGHCYLTMDVDRQTPFASSNINRVYLCGAEEGMSSAGVGRLIDLFATEGVKRFFVWLSPGPDMDLARGWLEAHGLSRIRRTGYPTLCRTGRLPAEYKTDLEVREVNADEIAQASDQLGETLWPEYARSAGREKFFHYMAFDGAAPGRDRSALHLRRPWISDGRGDRRKRSQARRAAGPHCQADRARRTDGVFDPGV